MAIKTTIASMQAASRALESEDVRDVKRLQVHKQTRLCKFFAVGQCTRGSACAFAHGQEKLRQQPDFSKTRLCADFMELGSCAEGDGCKFSHGKHELRPGSAAKIGRPSKAARAKANEEKPDPTELQARSFQLKQSLHDQAALRLMMQSAAGTGPATAATTATAATVPSPETKAEKTPAAPALVGEVKKPKPQQPDTLKAVSPSLDLEKPQSSFSRQTTWEGVEGASAAFSRGTSLASDAEMPFAPQVSAQSAGSPVSPIRELPELKEAIMVQVKNTFIEVSDSDNDKEQEFKEGLRRSQSMPLF